MTSNPLIDGPITINSKGDIEAFNSAAEAIFGYQAREVIGKNVSILMPEPYHSEHDFYLRNYLTSGKARIIGSVREVTGLRKDGSTFPLDLAISEVSFEGERKFVGVVRDISERSLLIQERANQQLTISPATSQALANYINPTSHQAAFDSLLDKLLTLTQSKFGFIAELFTDSKQNPYLKTHALSNVAWDEPSRQRYQEQHPTGLDFHNLNTLFGEVIRTKQQVISNHPEVDCRSRGTPKGHPELSSFLGIPLTLNGQLIGMVALANRSEDYHPPLIDCLAGPLAECTTLISAFHSYQQQQLSDEKCLEGETLIRLLLDSTSESIIGLDRTGECIFANHACCKLLGYSEADIIGQSFHHFIQHSHADGSPFPIEESSITQVLTRNVSIHVENELFWHYDGHSIPVDYRSHPIIKKGHTNGAIITFMDITERLKVGKKIWKLAHYDSLTGLTNRALFYDRMEQTLAQARRSHSGLYLFFIDLDGFKQVNNIGGHKVGDQVLKLVAGHLQRCVREVDTVARLDGDEFAIILSGIADKEHAMIVAYKIITTINEPFTVDEQSFNLGASIGIAGFPHDGDSIDDLINHSNEAMQGAKKSGKNRAIFYQDF